MPCFIFVYYNFMFYALFIIIYHDRTSEAIGHAGIILQYMYVFIRNWWTVKFHHAMSCDTSVIIIFYCFPVDIGNMCVYMYMN